MKGNSSSGSSPSGTHPDEAARNFDPLALGDPTTEKLPGPRSAAREHLATRVRRAEGATGYRAMGTCSLFLRQAWK
jgi:hypothetical protein